MTRGRGLGGPSFGSLRLATGGAGPSGGGGSGIGPFDTVGLADELRNGQSVIGDRYGDL